MIKRLFQKTRARMEESGYARWYMIIAICQCLVILAIQAAILAENVRQARQLPAASLDRFSQNGSGQTTVQGQAADRLSRVKWENAAFMGFQVWFAGMAVDVVAYQNSAEALVMALLNSVCALLGALQILDGVKWLNALQQVGENVAPLELAEKLQIALVVVMVLFAAAVAFLSMALIRECGWSNYKKVGADTKMVHMYRLFQLFVLSIKMDVFTQLFVSLFYLVQCIAKQGFVWQTILQLAVTLMVLPMLCLGRHACSAENEQVMYTFVSFECLVLAHYAIILFQTIRTGDTWYVWVGLVCLGIVSAVISAILGMLCARNFGEGLALHVQQHSEAKRRETERRTQELNGSWTIDEE